MYGAGPPYGGYPPAQSPYGPQYGQGPYGQGQYSQGLMVVQQPGMAQGGTGIRTVPTFMPPPGAIPGVPMGLEYLAAVNGIVVNQLVEWLEVFTGIETRNRYSLCNSAGQQVYFAYEQSSFAARQIAGKDRPFSMLIVDNHMTPVILVHRPYTCCGGSNCCGCTGCCADECLVECPPGTVIGRIVQTTSCCHLEFIVKDMSGQPMFRISGPVCTCCCSDHNYPIYSAGSAGPIGAITKKWGGMAKEMYTDADTFYVHFPEDLDVCMKALLIGATFLLDFMEYENNVQQNNHQSGGVYLM